MYDDVCYHYSSPLLALGECYKTPIRLITNRQTLIKTYKQKFQIDVFVRASGQTECKDKCNITIWYNTMKEPPEVCASHPWTVCGHTKEWFVYMTPVSAKLLCYLRVLIFCYSKKCSFKCDNWNLSSLCEQNVVKIYKSYYRIRFKNYIWHI